ncbi:TOM (translocase of outer membrane) complex component [Mycoemilia scoparia]|uniref:TOM (Translocase of outer membrane) complex component n=1 Tax=Mycoemilia scoparia TaxID=417184 RepID=A0A9W7ZYR0_9FUNG|nr:TOM (translocase of outer membrane) complex component [Mycoemilia scoparia]
MTEKTSGSLSKAKITAKDWKFYAAVAIPTIAAVGVSLWYLSSSSSGPPKSGKKSKKRATKAPTKDASEETAKINTEEDSGKDEKEDPLTMTKEQIEKLSESQRKAHAQSLKSRGNKFYQAKRHEKAIELYTKALLFQEDPVFYSNRAACYVALEEYEKTIQDCDSALKLNNKYLKALLRRAQAYENLGQFQGSLYDFISACILDNFNNNVASNGAERVLKKLAETEAKQRIEASDKRSPRVPSKSFITGYLNSFRDHGERAVPADDDQPLTEGDASYNKALDLISEKKYTEAIEELDAALSKGVGANMEANAVSLRGAFNFLKSNLTQAKEDFDQALKRDPEHVRTFLRMANLATEKKDMDLVSQLVDKAKELAPSDPETYFQSGQFLFLKQDFEKALKEYQKAVDLDPEFVYPHIQLGVAQFKVGRVDEAMATFKTAMAKFPERSDLFNYYGEVLAEQGNVADAIKAFEKAVELDKNNPLPYVNQAISVFQSGNDVQKVLGLIRDALEVDPECELAVAALSQIYLQMGMFEESLAMLRRAVELAKSEEEMISAITFRENTAAQYRFLKEHPELASKLAGGLP